MDYSLSLDENSKKTLNPSLAAGDDLKSNTSDSDESSTLSQNGFERDLVGAKGDKENKSTESYSVFSNLEQLTKTHENLKKIVRDKGEEGIEHKKNELYNRIASDPDSREAHRSRREIEDLNDYAQARKNLFDSKLSERNGYRQQAQQQKAASEEHVRRINERRDNDWCYLVKKEFAEKEDLYEKGEIPSPPVLSPANQLRIRKIEARQNSEKTAAQSTTEQEYGVQADANGRPLSPRQQWEENPKEFAPQIFIDEAKKDFAAAGHPWPFKNEPTHEEIAQYIIEHPEVEFESKSVPEDSSLDNTKTLEELSALDEVDDPAFIWSNNENHSDKDLERTRLRDAEERRIQQEEEEAFYAELEQGNSKPDLLQKIKGIFSDKSSESQQPEATVKAHESPSEEADAAQEKPDQESTSAKKSQQQATKADSTEAAESKEPDMFDHFRYKAKADKAQETADKHQAYAAHALASAEEKSQQVLEADSVESEGNKTDILNYFRYKALAGEAQEEADTHQAKADEIQQSLQKQSQQTAPTNDPEQPSTDQSHDIEIREEHVQEQPELQGQYDAQEDEIQAPEQASEVQEYDIEIREDNAQEQPELQGNDDVQENEIPAPEQAPETQEYDIEIREDNAQVKTDLQSKEQIHEDEIPAPEQAPEAQAYDVEAREDNAQEQTELQGQYDVHEDEIPAQEQAAETQNHDDVELREDKDQELNQPDQDQDQDQDQEDDRFKADLERAKKERDSEQETETEQPETQQAQEQPEQLRKDDMDSEKESHNMRQNEFNHQQNQPDQDQEDNRFKPDLERAKEESQSEQETEQPEVQQSQESSETEQPQEQPEIEQPEAQQEQDNSEFNPDMDQAHEESESQPEPDQGNIETGDGNDQR